jgi:hypothetical protein
MATASEQRFAPFEPVPSTRRERWWFSDGVWIDQGQEAAVVGAVWVHWSRWAT